MEESEKVEEIIEKPKEEAEPLSEGEKLEEKAEQAESVSEEIQAVLEEIPEPQAESEPAAVEVSEKCEDKHEASKPEIKNETVEVSVPEEKPEAVEDPPLTIEECDTGGDEVPDVALVNEIEVTSVEDEPEPIACSQSPDKEPALLTELETAPPLAPLVESSSVEKPASDVVAIDDDDDDDVDDSVDEDDDDDEDDMDDDDEDDDDGVSNEALNDDDEEEDVFDDDEEVEKIAKTTSSSGGRETHPPHRREHFDEDYNDVDDDDDDEEMVDLKEEDSNAAVVIGSSDEDEEPVQKQPAQVNKPAQKPSAPQYNVMDEELDYEDDDDDDDDYDDDDLMNAVVTSATKSYSSSTSLSPAKKRQRSESPSPSATRRREADEIRVLTRRINYGRIAKKKSLNWLYNKKKREAYKLILPSRRPSTIAAAMRSDQSGGLLHLKIAPPTAHVIGPKSLTKPSVSTPIIISRVETRTITPQASPQKSAKDECVIDLDSSPEKIPDTLPPRNQRDDQRTSEIAVKKPPDDKETTDEEQSTMQQTDKVRESIQKSTEEVEEGKAVHRLSCEQNKENLQNNEALKKEKDEVVPSKNDTEHRETVPVEEPMDTTQDTSESTLKPTELTISAVISLKTDIKEEKVDKNPSPPPQTVEEITASKVLIEDVQEREAARLTTTPQPASVVASKRRRSSSIGQERSKSSKPTFDTTTAAEDQDDEEEEYIHPTKKLREELQSNYPAHDRILNEYIEKTSNDSIDTIQRHIEQMVSEIQTLNDMIKAKEVEWNNMLHLKKVKEEICFRLTRRKQCMEIMATKVGEAGHSAGLDEDYLGNESVLALGKTPPARPNPQLSSTPIAAAINSLSSNICNFTAVSSSSSAAPTTAQMLIQNRANMKSSDLVKEKANTQRLHRNILPKPTTSPTAGPNSQQQSPSTNGPSAPSSSNQPILNSYLTSADSVQQLVDMMNGHHNNHSGMQNGGPAGGNQSSQAAMVGRQGPFKDVRSIIADFRQQHPEVVPRRGRRVKTSNNSNLSDSNTILGNALKSDTNSRPSSNDSSSHSLTNTNQVSTNHNNVNSFKDVLAPFAKSQGAASLRSAGGQQQNPPYPEVTLHPVSTPLNASGGQDQPTGSLLHGILTKFSRPNESANSTKSAAANQVSANYISSFSPTLARLLTAPERISSSSAGSAGNQGHHSSPGGGDGGAGSSGNTHHSMPGFGVNLSKVVGHNSEITITPVMNSMHQQSLLQQQLQQQQLKEVLSRAAAAVSGNSGTSAKDDHFLKLSSFAAASAGNDDDAEDSVDRLVIDEGVDSMVGGEDHQRIAPHAIGQEFNENEVPVCQGCKKHEAQFVCAGCGNQWYCSRECQVTAWDDHSEVCTATKQIRNKFNMLKSRDLERADEYFIVRRRKRNKFYPQFY